MVRYINLEESYLVKKKHKQKEIHYEIFQSDKKYKMRGMIYIAAYFIVVICIVAFLVELKQYIRYAINEKI